MPFQSRALSRFATSDRGRTAKSNAYSYATADTAADVLAAGYFDSARRPFNLSAGDMIDCSVDVQGTPRALPLVVASVIAGAVTVVEASGLLKPLTGTRFALINNRAARVGGKLALVKAA